MFGISDVWISLGYFLSVAGLLACVVYGLIYWNKGMEASVEEIQNDLDWEEKDEQLKSEI